MTRSLQLTAEAVGEQLTEKELDALAQAITCAEDGKIGSIVAGTIICWLMTEERITEGQYDALAAILRKKMGWERGGRKG